MSLAAPSTGKSNSGVLVRAEPERAEGVDIRRSGRIRGEALRRSMKWTLLAWIPGAFWFAVTMGGTATILLKYLGANAFWNGVMVAVPFLATLLQLPGALVVEWLGRRKRFFIWTVTFHRVLYIVIGVLPFLVPSARVASAALMILLIFLSLALNNFGGQAWVNWMSDLVPARVRGKYFARRMRAGITTMIIASVLLGLALDSASGGILGTWIATMARWANLTPLIWFVSVMFMIAGAVGMLDILAFAWVEEPPMNPSPSESLKVKLLRPLKDWQFMKFCSYWSVWMFSVTFCGAFWWLYVLEYFEKLPKTNETQWWRDHQYLMCFVMLPVGYWVGQFLGFPIWGRAVDRFGRKPVLFVSSMLHTVSWTFWIFLSPTMLPWMPLVQMMGGLVGSGQDIGSFNMILQFNRKGGSGYQATGSIIFCLAAAAGALISGKLLVLLDGFAYTVGHGTTWEHTFSKYSVLIVVGMLIKYGGDLVILPYVEDIKSRPRRETVRFVFQNMYGTLNTLAFAPVQRGLEATGRQIVAVHGRVTEAAGAGFKRWFR